METPPSHLICIEMGYSDKVIELTVLIYVQALTYWLVFPFEWTVKINTLSSVPIDTENKICSTLRNLNILSHASVHVAAVYNNRTVVSHAEARALISGLCLVLPGWAWRIWSSDDVYSPSSLPLATRTLEFSICLSWRNRKCPSFMLISCYLSIKTERKNRREKNLNKKDFQFKTT